MSGEDDVYLVCHRCGRDLVPGGGDWYLVNIEAVADPSPPDIDTDMSLSAIAREIERISESIGDCGEQELLDQVYRRMTVHLCRCCYEEWIEDPTGG